MRICVSDLVLCSSRASRGRRESPAGPIRACQPVRSKRVPKRVSKRFSISRLFKACRPGTPSRHEAAAHGGALPQAWCGFRSQMQPVGVVRTTSSDIHVVGCEAGIEGAACLGFRVQGDARSATRSALGGLCNSGRTALSNTGDLTFSSVICPAGHQGATPAAGAGGGDARRRARLAVLGPARGLHMAKCDRVRL